MLKKILFISILFTCSMPLLAQVNTEKFRQYGDTTRWSFAGQLEYKMSSGNVEEQEAEGELLLRYATANSRSYIILKGDADWKDGRRFSNKSLVHLRHVRDVWRKLRAEFFAQADYARERLLDRRVLFGAGLRHPVAEGLWLATAIMHEEEAYLLPSTALHERKPGYNRLSSYLSWRPRLNPPLKMALVVYYQPRLDLIEDHRLLAEASFRVGISNHFSITVDTNYRYDAFPPDGIKKYDLESKVGLAVSL